MSPLITIVSIYGRDCRSFTKTLAAALREIYPRRWPPPATSRRTARSATR
ncbi:hypothetical protein [Nocardia sp. BMG111209]|nr:hypothetical protein [Nocardia sp. BMG111209]